MVVERSDTQMVIDDSILTLKTSVKLYGIFNMYTCSIASRMYITIYDGEVIYSVYRIKDQTANAFAIRNQTGTELNTQDLSLFIAEGQWYVNGEPYHGKLQIIIPAGGVGIVRFDDVDTVYKELELPNGTPIDLVLWMPVPGEELWGTMIGLELGEISN